AGVRGAPVARGLAPGAPRGGAFGAGGAGRGPAPRRPGGAGPPDGGERLPPRGAAGGGGVSAPGRLRRNAAGYLLAGPFVAAFALFVAVPLVQSVWLSTRQTFGAAASEPVGAANFARLAADPRFWRAVANTAAFTAGSVALQIPTALALALLLNRPGLRGRGLYRLAFFAPQVVG